MFSSCLKSNSRSSNDRKACHWTMLSVITLNSIPSLLPSPFPFWGRTSHDSPAVSKTALHLVLSLHQFSLPIWFSYICNWTKLLIAFKYLFNIYLFKILILRYSVGVICPQLSSIPQQFFHPEYLASFFSTLGTTLNTFIKCFLLFSGSPQTLRSMP